MPPNLKPWNPRNLKAPSSCCCTGCANKPGSCIRGWYLSRQLSKGTYRLWKLLRVDSQKLRSKKQKLLVQLLQKRWLLHLRLRGSSPGPSFPKKIWLIFRRCDDQFPINQGVQKRIRRSWRHEGFKWWLPVWRYGLRVPFGPSSYLAFNEFCYGCRHIQCGSLLYPKKQQI